MKKIKKSIIYILIAIIAILLLTFSVYYIAKNIFGEKATVEYRCFESIEELDFLNDNIIKELPLLKDKNLKSTPVKYWCNQIEYNDRKYNLRAYVFQSVEDTRNYFKKVMNTNGFEHFGYSCSSKSIFWFSKTKYVIYNENCLLFIEGNYEHNEFIEDLNELTKNFADVQN